MKQTPPVVEVTQDRLQQALADGATRLSIPDATDLAPLAGQPITWLSLAGSRVEHGQLRHLAGCPLTHLDLSRAALVGLDPIRRALESRPDDMTARMVLAEVWAERYEFRWEPGPEAEFRIEDDSPSDPDAWIEAFGEEDLVRVDVPAHERIAALLQAAELYDLDLRALHGPLDGLAHLPTSLRGLHLSGTPVADPELSHLTRLSDLRLLDLSSTAVASVAALRELPLRALDLSGTQAVGPFPRTLAGLRLGKGRFAPQVLVDLPGLVSLAVVDGELGPDALVSLPPSLQQLTLYRCELSAAGTWALGGLRDVDLTRCRLSLADRAGLGALGELASLRLSRTDLTADDLEILRALDGLPILALGFMDIEPPVLEAFAASMTRTTVQLAYEER